MILMALGVLTLGALTLGALTLGALTLGSALAGTREVPVSREQITLSFAPLARQASPAVVNIYAKSVVTERRATSPLFDDPFFRRFFGDLVPGTPRKRQHQSLGSGVILDPAGLIVTNEHVIKDAQTIKVVLADRREFDAKVLVADDRTDLAVLQIDPGKTDLPFIEMRNSDELEVGDLVLAIGNPFGVGQTVTSGIVSALARTAGGITDYSFFIQTDAAINPGNSGGALISMDGRLIGINTAIYSGKGAGGGSVGIGFAIPSNMVRTVVDSARGGKVVRPWLGASGQSVTSDLAEQFGLDRPIGVVVNEVYPGGPADRAGLRVGDLITAFDEREVVDAQALHYRIGTWPIGQPATMSVLRRGKQMQLKSDMQAPPSVPQPSVADLTGQHPLEGARVANLSPAFAIEQGFDDMSMGVVVLGVHSRGAAATVGFRRGDVFLAINQTQIDGVETLKRIMAKPATSWQVSIKRGDRVLKSVFQN